MHLIASLDAMKLLTTLFDSKSMHLTILSQEAVNNMLWTVETIATDIGSANLKTAWQTPYS